MVTRAHCRESEGMFEKTLERLTDRRSYWDWTLDWQDPLSSPVLDTKTGFGGDGDLQQPSSTGVGYCLTEVTRVASPAECVR